jgi:protein-L-isoaspartate(D-aspartate) O-methyltransferase
MMTRGVLLVTVLAVALGLTNCGRPTATPEELGICDPALEEGSCVDSEAQAALATQTATKPPEVPELSPTWAPTDSAEELAYADAREQMVISQIERRGVSDPEVLQAMRAVPRHRFVLEQYLSAAYADHPLPIGYGQTISQPYIVAWMTELLELEPDYRVLEIGTGSGYQAAVLAEIVAEVYTVEIIPELATSAEERLLGLGYTNIRVLRADGYWGWEEHAPFDAIIVTAAPDHVPQPLVQQLKEGAHLVIPIGPTGGYQSLWQFSMVEGELAAREIAGVRFVPFTREE